VPSISLVPLDARAAFVFLCFASSHCSLFPPSLFCRIIKNSWGTHWGNSGYLHLSRGGNLCGLTNGVTLANAAGDLNDPVSVLQDHAIKEFLAGRPSTYVARV